ncbi:hypothetical protein ABIB00_002720 [Bradyrhizobium sp. LB14.3]
MPCPQDPDISTRRAGNEIRCGRDCRHLGGALISVGMTPACLNGEANVIEINSNDDWYGLSAGYSNVAGTRSLVLRSAR